MARTLDYNSSSKTINANTTTTVTFTSSDVPSDRVVQYVFSIVDSGAGTPITLSTITRIRVKANGVAIWDLSLGMLRAYLFRFSRGGYSMPNAAITTNAATATSLLRFSLPFFILDAASKDAADVCQFPPNSQVTIEITFTTAANQGGTITCGYMQTTVPQLCYPKLLGSPMNIAASTASGRYNITDDGIVEGIGINAIGLGRLKLVLGGAQVIQASAQVTSSANAYDANSQSMLWEAQQLDTDWSSLSAGTAGQDATPNDPIFVDVHSGLIAPPGASYVELTTLAAWAGVTNEATIYSVVPLGKAA